MDIIKNYTHTTVLLHEAVNGLNIRPEGIYIDGTFGRGGHSRLILSKLNQYGKLIAMDRDLEAIEAANSICDPRFSIIHDSFSSMPQYIKYQNLSGKINGILLDLGVSSPQLEDPKRGFSFIHNGILDMRMDRTSGTSAAQWLEQANIKDITKVLYTFGEEKYAKRIAKAIINKNYHQKIRCTKELAQLIIGVYPFFCKHKHPATRSFQAIRIYINNELEEIKSVLHASIDILSPGGRLSVISFHSLEDRIVKHFIRDHSFKVKSCSKYNLNQLYNVQQNQYNYPLKSIGKIRPSIGEIKNNPRARSALLRLAERIVV